MKIKAKIDRMVNSGNVKAIASVSLDGMFVVKNLKVMVLFLPTIFFPEPTQSRKSSRRTAPTPVTRPIPKPLRSRQARRRR